jgi:hypothetical protein
MFYPLIEGRIKAILREMQHADTTGAQPETCVLIDEPELHLHPNLQVKVFDYFRKQTTDTNTQIIITTHSPTIVEYASFEELYLLRPVELVTAGENQLIQVASDEERLTFLREVFGMTSNLTAMQPMVVVEGAEQIDGSKTISDRKLYRALHPGFDRVTLVAGGGKAECFKLRQTLEAALRSFSPTVRAVALLDRDLGEKQVLEGITYLPVSTIENFLLDPMPIWESLQSVIEKTPFKTMDDVSRAIDCVLDELTIDEVERRTLRVLGTAFFRPTKPRESITAHAYTFAAEVRARYSDEALRQAFNAAQTQVESLKASSQRREMFHGKEVLTAFTKKYLHPTGMAGGIFRYETARHARARNKVIQFFDEFFAKSLPEAKAPVVAQGRRT